MTQTQGLEQHIVTRTIVIDGLGCREERVETIACCTSLEAAAAARRLLFGELAGDRPLMPEEGVGGLQTELSGLVIPPTS